VKPYLVRASEVKANDPRAHLYLGRIQFESGAYGSAIEHLSTAASLDPENETAHELLGRSLIEAGSPESGERELLRTLEINPGNQGANLELGRIYEKADRNDIAMQHLERALSTNPNLDMATYILERIYYEEGLYKKAEKVCMQFLKYHPEDIQSLEILGWIYKIQDRNSEMIDVYGKLARIAPENTTYWSPVIQHHMESNEYGTAKQVIEKALEHNPYYAYGNVRYGQVLMHFADQAIKDGRREDAVELFSLARDHLGRARVDDRYADSASRLMVQVETRLKGLARR
jgi:tetratricopeptide (TPR) repeat protein